MVRKKTIAVIAVLLLFLITFSPEISVTALSSSSSGLVAIDCSNPDSPTSVKILRASELLSIITGEQLSNAETMYIDSVLEEAFFYSDSIPSSKISVNYDGENVYVAAESYEYVSADGAVVCWNPQNISFSDVEYELTYSSDRGRYECEFSYKETENIEDILYVNVNYEFEFALSQELGDSYKNYVYSCAVELCEEERDYELRLAAYNEYQQYLVDVAQYQKDLAVWKKYVSAKTQYDIDIKKYGVYVSEYAEYEKKLSEYNAYMESVRTYDERLEAYKAYLAAKAEYDKQCNDYELYVGLLAKAEEKLAIIDNAFVRNSKGNMLYATLWGPTVEEVISRRDELVSLGQCNPEDIKNAGRATERLRDLLKGYNELSEREDKYNYYVQNYQEIKDNFVLLYKSLHILYENDAVYAGVVMKEKVSRYVEFLSHLYVLQSALDDSVMRDDGWEVKGEYDESATSYKYYSYYDALDECQMMPDTNNADPSDLPEWPQTVEKPLADFETVEYPVVLPKVDEPIEPDKVKEPIEPEAVEMPVEPTKVEDPGEKPSPRSYTSLESAIMDAYKSGEIKPRGELDKLTLALRTSSKKIVPLDDRYVVTFYDDDGESILYQYFAGYNDIPEYKGAAVEKQGNEKYSYFFSGWRDENGAEAVFDEITETEINFYASYTARINQYKVTWIVDGRQSVEWYEYGRLPTYKYDIVKRGDERTFYTFLRWSQTPERVVADACYEAIFEGATKYYNVTFIVDDKMYSEKYEYGELPEFKGETYKSPFQNFVYVFNGWNKPVIPVKESTVYVADYIEYFIAEDENGAAVAVVSEDNVYKLSVNGAAVRIDRLAMLAAETNRDIKISFLNGKCNITVSALTAKMFADNGGAYISLICGDSEGVYLLELSSADGESVSVEEAVSVTFKFEGDKTGKYTKIYSVEENGTQERLKTAVTNGSVLVKISSSVELRLINEYSITVGALDNGVIVPDKREAAAGEAISFSFVIDDAYLLSRISVVGADSGKYYALDSNSAMIMPNEPIELTATLEARTYAVIFAVDGKIVSKQDYKKGDKVILPQTPVKEGSDGKIYHFVGWEPIVTSVNKDVTYNAVFKELLEQEQYFAPEHNNRFIVFLICAVVIALAFLAIIVLTVILVVKKVKRSDNRRNENKS